MYQLSHHHTWAYMHIINLFQAFKIWNILTLVQLEATDVKLVPWHHSMVDPQIVNEGDRFQTWKTAANILNKQQFWWANFLEYSHLEEREQDRRIALI
jgi:hypothetical protein